MKIVAISGSLRQASFNTALLEAARACLTDEILWEFGEIGDIPLYNEEIDGDEKPAAVQRLLDQVKAADGLVIASPEYNYGVPGGLKNAIDWISRPAYKSVLLHKPTLIMSASLSPVGGVRAQNQLKQILSGTLTPVYPAPEFALAAAHTQFENGEIKDKSTQAQLQRLMNGFCVWVESGALA